MSTLKIAISGGPGTGKTSLIEELENRGLPCSHEFSRQVIQHSLDNGSNVLPWDNLDAFSERVMQGRMEQFHSADGQLHFFDRTIIDTIAYQLADNLPVREEWHSLAVNHRFYDKVFLTPPWEDIFENDHQRRESFEKLLHLHKFLHDTYVKYGYEVVDIPKLAISERADWLIEQIEERA